MKTRSMKRKENFQERVSQNDTRYHTEKLPEVLRETWVNWVNNRPACVQETIANCGYVIGESFTLHHQVYYVLGYTENNEMIVTSLDPAEDYEKADQVREYMNVSTINGVKI